MYKCFDNSHCRLSTVSLAMIDRPATIIILTVVLMSTNTPSQFTDSGYYLIVNIQPTPV